MQKEKGWRRTCNMQAGVVIISMLQFRLSSLLLLPAEGTAATFHKVSQFDRLICGTTRCQSPGVLKIIGDLQASFQKTIQSIFQQELHSDVLFLYKMESLSCKCVCKCQYKDATVF